MLIEWLKKKELFDQWNDFFYNFKNNINIQLLINKKDIKGNFEKFKKEYNYYEFVNFHNLIEFLVRKCLVLIKNENGYKWSNLNEYSTLNKYSIKSKEKLMECIKKMKKSIKNIAVNFENKIKIIDEKVKTKRHLSEHLIETKVYNKQRV